MDITILQLLLEKLLYSRRNAVNLMVTEMKFIMTPEL